MRYGLFRINSDNESKVESTSGTLLNMANDMDEELIVVQEGDVVLIVGEVLIVAIIAEK